MLAFYKSKSMINLGLKLIIYMTPETKSLPTEIPSEEERVTTLCDTFKALGGTAFMAFYNMAPEAVKEVYDKVSQPLLHDGVVKLEDFRRQD